MGTFAIRAEGLGKQYRLHQVQNYFPTLRDALMSTIRNIGARIRPPENAGKQTNDCFWALRDVSFEVGHGEALGIIGHNGAGKSTLLKILSRITEPTTGKAAVRGRLASMLEVGTGFHPELTGRENIFLNGAILGMRRKEIQRSFDGIVAFADIEKFLDTPVKHYSNGMYLRLAFAVAAHLEPEILIADEVLAVGDAEFQKKCLGKMSEVARQGRTVVFVSHNLGVVQTLCTRSILLQRGTVVADGAPAEVVSEYLRALEQAQYTKVLHRTDRKGNGASRLANVQVSTLESSDSALATGRFARFVCEVIDLRPGATCSLTIYDRFGQAVTFFDSAVHGQEDSVSSAERNRFVCDIQELLLMPGRYRIDVGIERQGELEDYVEAAIVVNVEYGELRGRPVPAQAGYGSVTMPHRWINPSLREP